jgi:hypothetical protein
MAPSSVPLLGLVPAAGRLQPTLAPAADRDNGPGTAPGDAASAALPWSAPSFFVGGAVAIAASSLIERGEVSFAPMVAAPAYLTYLTSKVYLARIEDEQRRVRGVGGAPRGHAGAGTRQSIRAGAGDRAAIGRWNALRPKMKPMPPPFGLRLRQ